MKDDKIQTGLRIPIDRYNELKKIADRSGASVNSIILFLVDVGLDSVNSGIEKQVHASLHIQQHNSEQ